MHRTMWGGLRIQLRAFPLHVEDVIGPDVSSQKLWGFLINESTARGIMVDRHTRYDFEELVLRGLIYRGL